MQLSRHDWKWRRSTFPGYHVVVAAAAAVSRNVGLMAGAWATILAYEIYVRGILHSLASSQATNESVRESSDHSHSLWSGQDFQSN